MLKQITEDERLERYYASEPRIQSLYASPQGGEAIYNLFITTGVEKLGLPYQTFASLIGDTLLGFYTKEEMSLIFKDDFQLSPQYSESINRGYERLITPTPMVSPSLEAKERLDLRPQQPASNGAPGSTQNPTAAKPLTREELMNALGGKRTMAADIEALRAKREAGKGGEMK
jgi:hypothetical protein